MGREDKRLEMYFEDGGWGHEPRRARGLEKLKKTTEKHELIFPLIFIYLAVSGLSCSLQDFRCIIQVLFLRHINSLVVAQAKQL